MGCGSPSGDKIGLLAWLVGVELDGARMPPNSPTDWEAHFSLVQDAGDSGTVNPRNLTPSVSSAVGTDFAGTPLWDPWTGWTGPSCEQEYGMFYSGTTAMFDSPAQDLQAIPHRPAWTLNPATSMFPVAFSAVSHAWTQ